MKRIFLVFLAFLSGCRKTPPFSKEPEPESLNQNARIDAQSAASTQSVYFRFRDSNGDLFKANLKIQVWYFPSNTTDSTISGKANHNELGTPELATNCLIKSFDVNLEIRKILRFNAKAYILFHFYEGTGDEQYKYVGRVFLLPNRTPAPRKYAHFEVPSIDRVRGGI